MSPKKPVVMGLGAPFVLFDFGTVRGIILNPTLLASPLGFRLDRDGRGMNALRLDDLKFAIRRLWKDAGTTTASVAALACGIGAAVATWALVLAVLLKPLPIEGADRLFQVDEPPPPNVVAFWVPRYGYPVFASIRDSGTFEAIAASGAFPAGPIPVIEQGEVPQRRRVYFAAFDFFATLGIGAAHGRTFREDEDRRGAVPVVVLSDNYWRRVFDGDPGVLGRTVTVAGTVATIVGILPRGFRGLHLSEAPDLYLPLHVAGDLDHELVRAVDLFGNGSLGWINIVGRLRPGETPAAAAAQLNTLPCMCPRDLTQGEVGPLALTNINAAAIPELSRAGTTQFATLLSITVGLLLLVGCLTVGMLLLVRTEDRRDELAVRLALGATRGRLAASVAVEAALLCVLGGALAVPVALWFFYGIRAFQLPGEIAVERLELSLALGPWLGVTGAAVAATAAIALLASLVGIAAARSPMQPRALATPRVTRRAPRTVLVAGQVAITLVLVMGAGLFTRSLIEALTLNSAIDTDRIVTGSINLAEPGYAPERAAAFLDELNERLSRNGTIESFSILRGVGGMQAGLRIDVDGVQRELPSSLAYTAVADDYFATVGLPIVRGRGVASSDTPGFPLVAVVSESLGRLIADGGDPLGRRISDWGSFRQIAGGRTPETYLTVVGVVPDVVRDVNATEPLAVYQPIVQLPPTIGARFVLRAAGDAGAAMREMTATVRGLDPRVPLEAMTTLDEQIARQMDPQRFGMVVLVALGGIALLLTVLGTYVVAESMVVRRRRELGIRAALGARSAQLRRLVLRDTARLVGIGLVAGLAMAAVGARFIRSLLYQVEPLDPLVLVTVAAGIFGLALLVSLRPALEAARLDLTRSLREE
jgi:predicted permease